jgi:hypothetical protein
VDALLGVGLALPEQAVARIATDAATASARVVPPDRSVIMNVSSSR